MAWASLSAKPGRQPEAPVKPLLLREGDDVEQVAGPDPQPGHLPQLLAVYG